MAEDRVGDALNHLQTAALELIAALRAVLDVAEEAVREPQGLMNVVAATARAAAGAATSGPVAPMHQDQAPEGQTGQGGVEHIRIS